MSQNDHTTIEVITNQSTALSTELAADPFNTPAGKYIGSLKTKSSRDTMKAALNMLADILGAPVVAIPVPDKRCNPKDAQGNPITLQPGDLTRYDDGLSWDDVKAQFEAAKQSEKDTIKATGIPTYNYNGYTLENWTWQYAPWHTLTIPTAARIQATLAGYVESGDMAATGANKALSALRRVIHECWSLDYINADTRDKMKEAAPNIDGDSDPAHAGRALSYGELTELIKACEADPTNAGVRDAALIAFMYITGARRASVVKMNLDDYDRDSGRVIFRKAKRNKTYTTYATNGAKKALDDWLNVRGDTPGAVFLPITQTDVIEYHETDNEGNVIPQTDVKGKVITDENDQPLPAPRRMTPQAIYHILKKRGKDAKIEHFSPHDMRRTIAGDLLDSGADIVTVQKMLGHSDPSTTARYDRRPDEAKRAASKKLNVPYQGNKRKPPL